MQTNIEVVPSQGSNGIRFIALILCPGQPLKLYLGRNGKPTAARHLAREWKTERGAKTAVASI